MPRRHEGTMRELHDAVAGEVAKVVVASARRSRRCSPPRPSAATCCSKACPASPRRCSPTRSRARSASSSGACSSPRHAALRPDRQRDAARRRADLPPRPGVHERAARRRDQPHAAEDAGRAARGDAGGQVSVEGRPELLPDPFLVVATQNPIEYEGTYALPEAQLDRFLVKLNVGYPSAEEELGMLGLARRGVGAGDLDAVRPVASAEALREARARSTRPASRRTSPATSSTSCGAPASCRASSSAAPRAAVHLLGAARAAARLAGRDYVTPDDVSRMAAPVLRHRLVLTPEAELERYGPDDAVRTALGDVPTCPRSVDDERRGAPPPPCSRSSRWLTVVVGSRWRWSPPRRANRRNAHRRAGRRAQPQSSGRWRRSSHGGWPRRRSRQPQPARERPGPPADPPDGARPRERTAARRRLIPLRDASRPHARPPSRAQKARSASAAGTTGTARSTRCSSIPTSPRELASWVHSAAIKCID